MSEQTEWIFWQILSDTMRLFLLTLWIVGIALAYRSTRNFWRGFKEWESERYPNR